MTQSNPVTLVSQLNEEFADKEYRDAYVEANIAAGIAHQVRTNRESRDLTQAQLASVAGAKQSVVSRLEDPDYGRFSIKTLLKLASSFDCALEVRFVSFSRFLEHHADLSPAALVAKPYHEDLADLQRVAYTTMPTFVALHLSMPFDAPKSPSTVYVRRGKYGAPAGLLEQLGFTSTVSSAVSSKLITHRQPFANIDVGDVYDHAQ